MMPVRVAAQREPPKIVAAAGTERRCEEVVGAAAVGPKVCSDGEQNGRDEKKGERERMRTNNTMGQYQCAQMKRGGRLSHMNLPLERLKKTALQSGGCLPATP